MYEATEPAREGRKITKTSRRGRVDEYQQIQGIETINKKNILFQHASAQLFNHRAIQFKS